MEQLIESLELNSAVKEQLIEHYNNLIEIKTSEIKSDYKADLAEKEKAYEDYADNFISEKSRLYEDYADNFISEKNRLYEEYADKYMSELKESLENKLDTYLDKVIDEFVTEKTELLESNSSAKQYDAILEGFNSILVAAGVQIAEIAEAKGELTESEVEVYEDTQKIDSLMSELVSLKRTNTEMLKLGLINEACEDLTYIQKEKFIKLAENTEFDDKHPEKFLSKLDTIAEMVSKKETSSFKKPLITESKKANIADKKIAQNLKKSSHLY